jgi:cytochrome c oxidase cbb3-type subunit 1
MVTLSIVQSMMMIIPVAAFTVNQYQTLQGHLGTLRDSPTLRFIGVGGLMYTASSVQGCSALRSINAVTHFTTTRSHAHLAVRFVSCVLRRDTRCCAYGAQWPYPVITAHFGSSAAGSPCTS